MSGFTHTYTEDLQIASTEVHLRKDMKPLLALLEM